ncbi:hypothetical protein HGP16_18585 [Rhizobium sp. P40RR-XXII]|uniref:hypothetical protein n=1 Tax=Rhizobium sp. P40RR-XXII TaxID=2726739 RepID=UPI0014571506|nr:hypothetical protein [Rhizobium sp. P40RR-XXII]NLS18569.1 hypothetical protein [Rhizobium sp. P40RR-XXII]
MRLSETPGFTRESIRPGLGTLPTTKRIDRAGRASDSGFDFVNRLPHIRLTIRNQFDCQRLNVGTSGHREGLSNMIFGGSNMIPARYRTVRDAAWSWSVVDANTGRVMAYSNVILGGLNERIAEDMAKLLNLEYSGSDAETASSPRSGGT